MFKKTFLTAALLFVVGTMLVPGCAQQQQQRRPASQPSQQRPAAEPDRAERPAPAPRRSGWPTMRSGGGWNWSSMARPTGNASTSAIGIEKGMPTQVRLNQPFEYHLVVTNLTSNELSGVTVTDTPDPGMRITGATPAGRANGNAYTWALGKMAANESRKIVVNAVATQEGKVGSCASVAYNALLCATVPVVSPKLSLTKSGPAEVLKCDEITYRFEVANSGTGSIRNVKINDPLPAGLVGPGGSRNVTFDAGTLNAGQKKQFSTKVKANRTGRFENTASATGDNGASASSNPVTTVVRAPVLTITKRCPNEQFIGRAMDYTIVVTNTGDGVARDTVIRDQIPAGAEFVSASDGGQFARGTVTWNAGNLAPRASKTVTLRLNPTGANTYRNTATASAYCADAVTSSCETVVSGIPAILLEVIDIGDPVRVGDNETYVITVTNQGSAPSTNVRIVATLEPNQTHVSNTGATRGTARGQVVTFEPLPSLAPKAKATWRLVVKCTKAGDTRLTLSMTSDRLTRPVQETEATNIYD